MRFRQEPRASAQRLILRKDHVGLNFQFLRLVSTAAGVAQPPNESPAETKESSLVGFQYRFAAMGTMVEFKAFGDSESQVTEAFKEAEKKVLELAAILTDYDPKSETRQLATSATSEPKPVSDSLWQVLQASEDWYRRTDGAFDASLGSLTKLWRKYRRSSKVPTEEEILTAKKLSGWRYVQLYSTQQSVRLEKEGVSFDFGAIGKGYIVDAAFDLLREHGLGCCLVNISGNMRCGNAPPGRKGWRIQVSPLEENGSPLRQIQLSNESIATSGDLWQFVVMEGVRRSHILDPRTGYGVPGPIAATVVSQNATDADACATAACIMNPADLEALLAEFPRISILRASKSSQGEVTTLEFGDFPKPMDVDRE